MKAFTGWICTLAAAWMLAGPAVAAEKPDTGGPSCAVPGYDGVYVPQAKLYTSGLPGPGKLEKLHEQLGVGHVMDLRADTTPPDGELAVADRARTLGLDYRNIPVAGPDDLTADKARALDKALADAGEQTVLLHCTTGKRAAALLAVRNVVTGKKTTEEALDVARRSGVGSLEPALASALEQVK